jgi:hypothetical protein
LSPKPPPDGPRFRRKPQVETLSGRNPNPVQPDSKPPPAREGKRNKRINPVDGRPLGAATATSLNNIDDPESAFLDGQHAHLIDEEGVCLRCNEHTAPGLGDQLVITVLARSESLDLQPRLAGWPMPIEYASSSGPTRAVRA